MIFSLKKILFQETVLSHLVLPLVKFCRLSDVMSLFFIHYQLNFLGFRTTIKSVYLLFVPLKMMTEVWDRQIQSCGKTHCNKACLLSAPSGRRAMVTGSWEALF